MKDTDNIFREARNIPDLIPWGMARVVILPMPVDFCEVFSGDALEILSSRRINFDESSFHSVNYESIAYISLVSGPISDCIPPQGKIAKNVLTSTSFMI